MTNQDELHFVERQVGRGIRWFCLSVVWLMISSLIFGNFFQWMTGLFESLILVLFVTIPVLGSLIMGLSSLTDHEIIVTGDSIKYRGWNKEKTVFISDIKMISTSRGGVAGDPLSPEVFILHIILSAIPFIMGLGTSSLTIMTSKEQLKLSTNNFSKVNLKRLCAYLRDHAILENVNLEDHLKWFEH